MPEEIVKQTGEEIPEGEALETTTGADQEEQKSEEPEVPEKTFTQKELDEILEKRLARERRKLERERQAIVEPAPLQIESKLDPNQFQTTEAYLEALANEKAEAIVAHREKSRSVQEIAKVVLALLN